MGQPAPVEEGAALLDDVTAFITRYVVLQPQQADAIALWVAHSHAIDGADATPYLAVTSAEKRSGKTRLLEVLELLVPRPWLTGRCTAAVLTRKVDQDKPTLLLDEGDAAFGGDKEFAEALRSILNAGHRRGLKASMCVPQGKEWAVRDFDVFGAKAIASIRGLPDTVADRSISIMLRRRAPSEPLAKFRRRKVPNLAAPLREQLEGWAVANMDALSEAEPAIPDALDDRAADGWEPLLAIAHSAGGDWPQRARAAALALSTGDGREDDSLGVRLLADIRAIFKDRGVDRLPSADLVQTLNDLEESPWGDLRGRPLDPRRLASLLRPYSVRPVVMRVGSETLRGYAVEALADPWRRYLPPVPRETATSATSATPASSESASE